MPGGGAALAARAFRLLPEGLAARLLPRRLRYDPRTLPVATAPSGAGPRLLVAPVNFAGQGSAWARSVDRAGTGAKAVSMAYRVPGTGYGFPVDVEVPASAYTLSRSWHRRQFDAIAAGFSHVLVETGRPPAGAPYSESAAAQISRLRAAGVRCGYLAHGTDVRVPSAHAAAHADSPFRAGDHAALEAQADENLALIADLGLPAFVSTPDLLEFLPEATWLPVVVDPATWATSEEPLRRARPLVVHAPSSGPMKGSDAVDPVMAALHEEGVIEYRRITGVAASEMPAIYRDADVVLEQFRIGGYGVAACEAMAAGRIVVGHVTPDVRRRVADAARAELPIVEASLAELEAVVRQIASDRDRFRAIAAEGPSFVTALHDGRASAAALADFLAS